MDDHPVKLNSGTAEFDKAVTNEGEGNYDKSMRSCWRGLLLESHMYGRKSWFPTVPLERVK